MVTDMGSQTITTTQSSGGATVQRLATTSNTTSKNHDDNAKPPPMANPKDSMKSTWRQDSERSTWTVWHYFFEILGVHPTNLDEAIPVHPKTDKVPYTPQWHMHRWVLVHSFVPVALQQLYIHLTGGNLTPFQAFLFYSASFKLIAIRELAALRRVGHKVGFLDGDLHERDQVPDVGVYKTVRSLLSTSTFRPVFTVFLSYRASQAPAGMSWLWLPLEIGLYGIILDFWFYWYHRLMHEVGSLWSYHRTHHLTKHPNPLLTLYADTEQEFFDIAGIPLLTYFTMRLLGLPMGFHEWWVCQQYVMFAELAGHSGLRVVASPPSTLTWLLRLVGAELIIEDHDMHHRKGWKVSGNYGKQTRLWDKVFGTLRDRVECTSENIDWGQPAPMPLWG
ncbi:hypothetical protein N3K66_009045 [Trichothecium roseum]|uniref:Uncharacterized protein n=1 Tax=Trichothecium roseum TaxID=47278 RepID=A0ACC0UQZ1_9HYPO|nr:hypothetical protein N3K66_009045 [Trichothecium roseum]